MKPARLAPLLVLLTLACAKEDATGLRRRAIAAPTASGWARLPLDAAAQAETKGLWISDPAGRSVPFLVAREGLWAPQPLDLDHPVLGTDGRGRPSAEFGVKLPEGWRVGERAKLRLDLDLEGDAPWVATVEAARQRPGGAFLAFDAPPSAHLYDLAPSSRRAHLDLPWDGERYRIALRADQGRAPRIRGLRVSAETGPAALAPEQALMTALEPVPDRAREWRLTLPQADRVVGLDLTLTPPAAPLRLEAALDDGAFESLPEPVWNLPALGSSATRLSLPPTLARRVTLRLPAGARPESAVVRIRRQVLLFPAEAGQAYALHLGGEARPAPGDLGALPSSRLLLAAEPLALGPEGPDPDGLPRRVASGDRARPWMPWLAGAAVLVLALAAWRLMRGGDSV
ncbi:hypothetical protein GETHPA_11670 [Geothrix rubra]|uniref:DUF3999 family protein n=1 Tax=Geothrix rubra TaxID=2927977 RepID=A0ABQ5Q552_9BACT|nr:hypothetical protein [Geothrix rubra]GLH69634.1 hypothetical protein GETHPA_11670 [Geothrix rubra]